MLRRRRFWLVLTALVCSTLWWEIDQSKRRKTQRLPSTPTLVSVVQNQLLPGSRPESKVSLSAPAADPGIYAELNAPTTPPINDLKIVDGLVIDSLASERARNRPPLEVNEDITRRLTEANTDGLAFLPADHPAIDGQGRLCDRWGTPYFFHPLSGTTVEIRSAGPDRKFFTNDDLQWPGPPIATGPTRERLTSGE